MTEFTALYKTLSNSELLKIIAEAEKYNPIAVETAEVEIDSRKLSVQQLNQVKSELNEQEEKKKFKIEKRKHQEEKIKKVAATFFDTINPIQDGIQTPEKAIRLLTLLFTAIAVYRIFEASSMFRYLFFDNGAKWDLSLIEYFFPILILPLGTFLFWKRKKSGWVLVSLFLTYSVITTISLFFINLSLPSSSNTLHTVIFSRGPSAPYIFSLLFFGGALWVICKESLRHRYTIAVQTMAITIGLATVLNLFFIYVVMG